ncbi:MAG: hypothetical protein EB107_07020, partial [Proteobacteria bacterium]|nr:hypothetical protein [Pseudomonadota bacterium]
MTTGSRRALFAGAARIAAGAATATGLFTLAACGGDSGGGSGPIKLKQAVSLQYWSILGGADGTRMHDMTAQYTKEQPMVKIEDVQGVDNFLVKFVASVVAGSPPDIVWIRQT